MMQHVFVSGDPQSFSQGVCVKGWIQSQQRSMNPFTLEVVCKLLRNTKSFLSTRDPLLLHYLNKAVVVF